MYNGIEITEIWLVVEYSILTILLLAVYVAVVFWLCLILSDVNTKNIKRMKSLKEKALTDEIAQKRLEKLERKKARKKKQIRQGRATNIIICILLFGVLVIGTGYTALGWIDYVKKDYVIYIGEFEVSHEGQGYFTDLADGTVLYGTGGFDYGNNYGTIVYAKRSKIVLGGQESEK